MTITLIPDPCWADADTYRHHVQELMRTSGLDWRLIAAHAGVSPRAMDTLLRGRNGRPVRTIHVTIAQALNHLDAATLTEADTTEWVDKRTAAHLLTCLQLLGHSVADLPWVTADDVTALLVSDNCSCTLGAAARVQAAYDLITGQPEHRQRPARVAA